MKEEIRQHLEFIQNIITRMNTNSFQIKGLMITIITALMAIYASQPKITLLIFLGIPPTFILWLLDSYYLQQERKFRGVYNNVVGLKKDIKVKLYEMPIQKCTKTIDKQYCYWNVFFSFTVLWLYLPTIIFLSILGVILQNAK